MNSYFNLLQSTECVEIIKNSNFPLYEKDLNGKNHEHLVCRAENPVVEYNFFKVVDLFTLKIKNLLQNIKKPHTKYMGRVKWFIYGLNWI